MTDAMGVALFPFLLLQADLPFRFPECRCVLVSTENLKVISQIVFEILHFIFLQTRPMVADCK